MSSDLSDLANVEIMPVWNKRVSAADRLREVAVMAEKNPHLFDRVVIGYVGHNEAGMLTVNYALANCDTIQLFGILELVRARVHEVTGPQ